MSKCYFQDDWLQKFPWICRVPGQMDKASCKLCMSSFNLSNMGVRAVNSHRTGKKHTMKEASAHSSLDLKSCLSITKSDFYPEAAMKENLEKESSLDKFVLKNNCTRAEIIWCLQTVLTHKSLRSAEKDVKMFASMFHDSAIAKTLHLSRIKMAYIIVHGLSPFFKQNLLDDITAVDHLVIGFDECLNKITQKQQMDVNVRFWDSKHNVVKTCYLTSEFLQRSCAKDLLEAFLAAVEPLKLKRILQISMDGPNTNILFFKELQKYIKQTPEDPEILTIGSCGLHALNVAFKTGEKASDWSLVNFFRSLYYVFKDSPARRAWYISLTGSTSFPKKFCFVRWLENSAVALRALEMIPHLKQFVDGMDKEKIAPKSKSYGILQKSLEDRLLPAKICFFRIVSNEIEGFLREYQSDFPLIPFLFSDLTALIKGLMERFIQKDVLKNNTNVLDIKVNESKNHVALKNIDIGISTLSEMKKAKVLEKDIVLFKSECLQFLIKCVLKLQERSPLKYTLTKAVSCFDPIVVMNDKVFSKRLGILLLILVEKKWITSLEAEDAKKQLKHICSKAHIIMKCKGFKRSGTEKERIDKFWFDIFSLEEESSEAQKILKIIMILSHGNANVERGFSINSDCLWENMNEQSVVARRRVYDYVTLEGGLSEVKITRKMIQYCHNARAKYSEAQELQRKSDKEQETLLKRKRDATVQLKELEAKKAKIMKEAEKESLLIEEEMSALRAIQKK